jgi:hypothetical protein
MIPAFNAPTDCTPRVLGDVWPDEFDVARAFAVLRVESTVRQLRNETPEFHTGYLSLNAAQQATDTTQLIPVIPDEHKPETTQAEQPDRGSVPAADPVVNEAHAEIPDISIAEPTEPETDEQRLPRLLEFVARQEPGLRWAIGVAEDGGTVLATDLAHGWIPSGIELPADVQLLEPGWRDGNAAPLLGAATLSATYAPGDRLGRATECGSTEPSLRSRELPVIDDLGWVLAEATHWRDGLPRLVNTLARAGAAGTGVVDAEIDLLRVHLDTVRYQLLAQYPDIDTALLLNCMLSAATEGIAAGDKVSAFEQRYGGGIR